MYDVTGSPFYKENGSYSFFAACDATRSFITGDFDNLSDNLTGFNEEQLQAVVGWQKFYDNKYTLVGFLVDEYLMNEKCEFNT